MKSNPGFKPFHKKQVVVWVANKKDVMTTKSGLHVCSEEEAGNRIARLQEGEIVEITSGCFEGEEWDSKPKVGDKVCFKGYVGNIYEHDENFYRIMEDKFLTAPSIK